MLRFLGLSRDDSGKPLPPDKLQVKHLASGRAVFQAHSGVPVTSDSLAYEPVQRLIAVATTDGRIKIVGRDGVERAVYSSACANCTPAATQQLLFLINRGGLVRLDQDGLLELFAVDPSSSNNDDPSQPLASLSVPDDTVHCMAALQQEPYLLLGCRSGAVRVAALVNASGEAVTGTRQVRGLALLPYTIPARKLGASGAVTHLTVQSQEPYQHMLALHQESGVALWDLRAQLLVAQAGTGTSSSSSNNGGKVQDISTLSHSSSRITAAEWLYSSRRGDFATGHVNGDINIWILAGGSSNGSAGGSRDWREGRKSSAGQQLQQPLLVSQLRVAAAAQLSISMNLHQQRFVSPERRKQQHRPDVSRQKCRPVQSLQYVSMGHAEGLLVFGGGEDVQPDGLLLLPLPEPHLDLGIEDTTTHEEQQQSIAAAALKLPWIGFILGHALVPHQGALTGYEEPSAVLVLAESGEVIMHDISVFAADASHTVAASKSAAAAAQDSQRLRRNSISSSPTQYNQRSPRSSSPAAFRAASQFDRASSFISAFKASSTSHADAVAAAAPQRLFTQLLQGQQLITAARLRLIPIERVPLQGLQGASMVSLHDWAARNAATAAKNPEAVSSKWVVAGGKVAEAPCHSSCGGSIASGSVDHSHSTGSGCHTYTTLYCTGHSDGGVRLWAMHSETPLLLGVAPSAAALEALHSTSSSKAAPISTLEFAWEQGLLISGHQGGEVRVYQFSEAPKQLECVLFQSVGSRSNNEAIYIQEPAGFQLRMLTHLHSADIVSSTYVPQFKMVAVSDRSGSVSLIDLAKPAVPWFQAPWNTQPVVSLALGKVPMPAPRERHPALAAATQKVAAGAAVRAVVAIAADSQMAVLDAETGFFLSRNGILTPKHTSPALHVELLDADGAPTWMSRDVQGLVDLAHERQQQQRGRSASPAAAARGKTPHLSRSSAAATAEGSELYASAAASWESQADGRPEVSEDDEAEGSLNGREDGPDVDEHELLEKAAAEIEAEESRAAASKKQKRRKQQQQQPEPADPETSQQRHSSPSKQRQSTPTNQRYSSPSKKRGSDDSTRKLGLRTLGGSTGSLSDADTSSSTAASKPIVLSEPMACYVLVATQHYLRIYPISHVVSGDRTTCKRISLAGPLQFASTFAASGAPALVCLLELEGEQHMQVYTLPRLELIKGMPLSSLLGWRWTWDPRHTAPAGAGGSRSPSQALTSAEYDPYSAHMQQQHEDEDAAAAAAAAAVKAAALAAGLAAASSRLASVCAATRHGHLALVGPGNELVRLTLVAGTAGAPVPPPCVYDWDVAAAAHAAGAAVERQQLQAWVMAAMTAATKRSGGDSSGGRSSSSTSAATAAAGGAGVEQDGLLAADSTHSSSSSNIAAAGGSSGGGAGAPGNKIDLKGFMTKIGGDMKRAGDEVKRGLQKVAQVIETELTLKPGQQLLPEYLHPPLAEVFGTPAPGEATGNKASSATVALSFRSPPAAPAAAGKPLTPKAAAAGVATGSFSRLGSSMLPTAVMEVSPPRAPKSQLQRASSAAPAPKRSEGVFDWPNLADLDLKESSISFTKTRSAMPVTVDKVPAAAAAVADRNASPSRSRSPASATLNKAAAWVSPFAHHSTGSSLRRVSPVPGQEPLQGSAPAANTTSLIGDAIYRQQSGGLGAFSSGAAGGGSRVRTADEIRQKYGRAQLKSANETRGIMEETQIALAQRGERLSKLQEQTADLVDSAAGFAELAKQLAEKEKGKTKWFG